MNIEILKTKSEEEIIQYIRDVKMGRSFNMSGYDEHHAGDCVLHNMEILNLFAPLGIYDYTHYLFLGSYKGTCTVYFKYWGDEKSLDTGHKLAGWSTSEIIYHIFELTILANTSKKRTSNN